ncbi:MAG: DegV family protein [Clostridia bacterium]|nr:DegV family protein [Clostridia bacterium]
MKKIAITTDSNSGLLPQEAPDGVFVLPMPFLVNGEPHFENIDLSQEKFYSFLEGDASVSTSQPSIGDLSDFWTDILKNYDSIVHIPMSSGLSQACATAIMLAKDFGSKVTVVDNHRISITMKESVMDAVKLREQGKNPSEIKEYLEKTAADSSIYIAVDTMKYLKKGGRVTPAAAAIGSILKLKPVLQIHGEKLDKYALTRGNVKAKEALKTAMKNDLETVFKKYVDNGEMCISVAYSDNKEEVEAFAKEFQALMPNVPFHFCDPLSLSVACHIGPGAIGFACSRFVK